MNFTQSIRSCFKKYVVFNGRSARSEFWYWYLFNVIIGIIMGIIFNIAAGDAMAIAMYYGVPMPGWVTLMSSIFGLISFALFIPTLAVSVRRLHDIGKSGLWYLIIFVPLAGVIIYIVFMCKDSQPGTNQYGPNPKGVEADNTMAV